MECFICFTAVVPGFFQTCTSPSNPHYFCNECLQRWIRIELDTFCLPRCPLHNCCRGTLSAASVHACMRAEDGTCLARFWELTVATDPNACQCPHCGAMQLGDTASRNGRMVCVKCEEWFLFLPAEADSPSPPAARPFRITVSPVTRSPRSRRREGLFSRLRNVAWKHMHTRKCPHCLRRVQRNGGCARMKCTCGCSWCWDCGHEVAPGTEHSRSLLVSPRHVERSCQTKRLMMGRATVAPVVLALCVAALPPALVVLGYNGAKSLTRRLRGVAGDESSDVASDVASDVDSGVDSDVDSDADSDADSAVDSDVNLGVPSDFYPEVSAQEA
eukprot:Rmarinus@m.30174